jgi:hypothetical protein
MEFESDTDKQRNGYTSGLWSDYSREGNAAVS